jgi:hypothetical protein
MDVINDSVLSAAHDVSTCPGLHEEAIADSAPRMRSLLSWFNTDTGVKRPPG